MESPAAPTLCVSPATVRSAMSQFTEGGLYCAPTPPLEVSPLTWDIATTSKRCKSLQNCLAVCAGGSTTGWTKRSQTPAAGPDAAPLPFRR